MGGVLAAAVAIGCVYGLIVAGLFAGQRSILYRPDRSRPDIAHAPFSGLAELAVRTADGLSLLAWFLPPSTADQPVVLYLHGNGGHIGNRVYRLEPYHRLGWGILLLDYRGYGGNPGAPSETGLLIDARAGYAALRGMGYRPDRILLWGESLGTAVAARLGAEQPSAAIVLESPFTSIAAIAKARYPWAPVDTLLRDRFDTMAVIRHAMAPVLVLHGEKDSVVPVAMARAVYAAAPEPKALWIASEGGHLDLVDAGAIDRAGAFMRRLSGCVASTRESGNVPVTDSGDRRTR